MNHTIEFEPNEAIRRRELHERFGGQNQGGISTPRKFPVIFLFTGPTGREHGYGFDGWIDRNTFHFTGEGQPDKGDMQFLRGNKAILNHASTGKRLFLFEQLPPTPETRGWVKFVSELEYSTHQIRQTDSSGVRRQVIVFELTRIES